MVKRTFDFTIALLGLVLASPIWLLATLAIYLEDLKPVLFRQERCGKEGKTFMILKFRTMRYLPDGKHLIISPKDDPRVTKVGRLLRASAIDELPTLVNILIGDMSFVGPKPLPLKIEVASPYRTITEVPGYEIRSQVRPGLTGMAQVYAPKDIDHRNKFRYDNLYVKRRSFRLDLSLILLSFWVTFRGKWEHRGKKI